MAIRARVSAIALLALIPIGGVRARSLSGTVCKAGGGMRSGRRPALSGPRRAVSV